mgnify:CR=1 FL=1|jgi:hypothetical protein
MKLKELLDELDDLDYNVEFLDSKGREEKEKQKNKKI